MFFSLSRSHSRFTSLRWKKCDSDLNPILPTQSPLSLSNIWPQHLTICHHALNPVLLFQSHYLRYLGQLAPLADESSHHLTKTSCTGRIDVVSREINPARRVDDLVILLLYIALLGFSLNQLIRCLWAWRSQRDDMSSTSAVWWAEGRRKEDASYYDKPQDQVLCMLQ